MNEILLVGAGGHAYACIDVLELENKYSIGGFIEKDFTELHEHHGYLIVGSDNNLEALRLKYGCALITIGQIKTPKIRMRLFKLLKSLNYDLPVIKSPISYASRRAIIDEGTIVMHGAIINSNASIGKNCIINSNSLIEHDAWIGNHCHISTGAIVNGGVEIGHGTFIGSGAIISNSAKIGNNCIVGSGVILKKDLSSGRMIK